jgi:hypothetical protein
MEAFSFLRLLEDIISSTIHNAQEAYAKVAEINIVLSMIVDEGVPLMTHSSLLKTLLSDTSLID